MRDPNRIPAIIGLLRDMWEASPDLRLGQLILNAHARVPGNSAELFHLEEEFLFEGLKRAAVEQRVISVVKLRADIERIGRERDQMVAANIELQQRLSKLERRTASLDRIAQLRGALADALNSDPERIEAEARASAQLEIREDDRK